MAEPFVLHINPSPSSPTSNAGESLIRSMADQQIVLQIGQTSTTSKPHDGQSNPPSTPGPPLHGTLHLKVTDPILLHINSLTPLLNNPPNPISTPPPRKEQDQQPSNPPNTTQELLPKGGTKHQTALSKAGNLANLLPTGTVLAFQAITPSLSYNGRCQMFNKHLVALVMIACSLVCFLSSFADSLEFQKKVYYGIATSKGLSVFNYEDREVEEKMIRTELEKLKIRATDFVHAFVSAFVFLIFASSSLEVQACYFPAGIRDELEYSMVIYLPLVAGILSTFLFSVYPTKRRGIGYTCSRT